MPASSYATFPRSVVPEEICDRVREARRSRRWSQDRLGAKVRVTRRTIMRIEKAQHIPTAHLLHDLEEALDLTKLVPSWPEPLQPSKACYGPRVCKARRAAGVTAAEAARAAGVSPATFSRFEVGATVKALVGGFDKPDEGIRSDALAVLLGFENAMELNAYCEG